MIRTSFPFRDATGCHLAVLFWGLQLKPARHLITIWVFLVALRG
jgi:hypothetical protein